MRQQRNRYMKLGLMIDGKGDMMQEWRHPEMPVMAATSLPFMQECAVAADKGGFEFLLLTDQLVIDATTPVHRLSSFEPLTLLSALAMVTERIGLVATVSTTFSEPFVMSRMLASLDHLSAGRAGWNIVTSPAAAAINFAHLSLPEHEEAYARAAEYMAIASGLWESWDADAFVCDKERGHFWDEDKQHPLHHKGKYFKVAGPLNIARSPQTHPYLFHSGVSEQGRAFGVAHAEAIISPYHQDVRQARHYYAEMKLRAQQQGKPSNTPLIIPRLLPTLCNSIEEARQLDLEMSKRGNWYDPCIGTSEMVADYLAEWFLCGAADGFVLRLEPLSQLTQFVDEVIPLLVKKGLLPSVDNADASLPIANRRSMEPLTLRQRMNDLP